MLFERARGRLGATLAVGMLACLGAAGAPACSTPEHLGGSGAACILFTDCDPHFVCYKNVCTSNLSGLVNMEPLPSDGAADAPVAEGGVTYPEGAPYADGPPESSYEGATPQPEAAPQPEAGSPEAGPSPQEAAVQEASPQPQMDAQKPGPEASPSEAAATETSTPPAVEAGE